MKKVPKLVTASLGPLCWSRCHSPITSDECGLSRAFTAWGRSTEVLNWAPHNIAKVLRGGERERSDTTGPNPEHHGVSARRHTQESHQCPTEQGHQYYRRCGITQLCCVVSDNNDNNIMFSGGVLY